jgi:hypothetical protein
MRKNKTKFFSILARWCWQMRWSFLNNFFSLFCLFLQFSNHTKRTIYLSCPHLPHLLLSREMAKGIESFWNWWKGASRESPFLYRMKYITWTPKIKRKHCVGVWIIFLSAFYRKTFISLCWLNLCMWYRFLWDFWAQWEFFLFYRFNTEENFLVLFVSIKIIFWTLMH